MYRKLLVIAAITFIGCQNQSENSASQTIAGLSPEPELVASKTDSNESQSFNTNSTLGLELKNSINDPSTDDYFVKVFNHGEFLLHADDNKMLSITDSLFSTNPDKDFFYFIVFTKSLNGADGFYSEAAGVKATEFVTKKTEWFADYFNIGPTLTEADMQRWANAIVGEIQIEKEGEEAKAIDELEFQLRKNIRTRRKEYSFVIDKLIDNIRDVEKERITNH